jgi:hypothetical protein
MGRILDLFGEVAAAADEGPGGVELSQEDRERLRDDWSDEDIDDALEMVKDNLLQGELVAAADSLSARLVEMLGAFGKQEAYEVAAEGKATISLLNIAHLARRVDRLEEILEVYRDGDNPDRRGFDELRQRILDHGIEEITILGQPGQPSAMGPATRGSRVRLDEEEEESEE